MVFGRVVSGMDIVRKIEVSLRFMGSTTRKKLSLKGILGTFLYLLLFTQFLQRNLKFFWNGRLRFGF